jgi:hypothetical protein
MQHCDISIRHVRLLEIWVAVCGGGWNSLRRNARAPRDKFMQFGLAEGIDNRAGVGGL